MLGFQWSFIDDFSWFVITLVTFSSICDTLGRFLARIFVPIKKGGYLISSLIRGVFFSTIYLLTFYGADNAFFGATWWIILGLFWFAMTFGYWITLGFQYGADESTGD